MHIKANGSLRKSGDETGKGKLVLTSFMQGQTSKELVQILKSRMLPVEGILEPDLVDPPGCDSLTSPELDLTFVKANYKNLSRDLGGWALVYFMWSIWCLHGVGLNQARDLHQDMCQ